MADESHGANSPSPRHAARPDWMDDPEANEDTHVLRRADLEAAARGPVSFPRPRRSATEPPINAPQPPREPRPCPTPARRAASSSPASRGRHTPLRWNEEARLNHAFRTCLGWTVLGAIVPGLTLSRSRTPRRRVAGLTVTGFLLIALTIAVFFILTNPTVAATVVVRPKLLTALTWGLPILAIVLVALLTFSHLDLRPRGITQGQRWLSTVLVTALCTTIATPLAVAGRYAYDGAHMLGRIFTDQRSGTRPSIDYNQDVKAIWASKPRVNVLLVGADDTKARNYSADNSMNTDTIMVASINTSNGDTSIFQIPRNTAKMPFPADSPLHQDFPDGFVGKDGDGSNPDYMANEIWSTVSAHHVDRMGETDYPGADALKLATGEALGLKIDYFVMLDIDGLQKLIDALGGVTVNVNERLPIAGNTEGKKPDGYLKVGPDQHLDGYHAMWYARSRSESTDYDRMGRQSCLMKAVLDQASPQTVLTRFESIADASGQMVVSDIPQGMLPAFVDLAINMRDANINRVVFTNGKHGFVSANPDYDLVRKQVDAAIHGVSESRNKNKPVTGASAAKPSKTATPTPARSEPKKSSHSATPSSASTNRDVSQSVTDACAYNPQEP
ncbi:MAG: LCP family protein [Cutibacterium avidum]|uniref:Cell envelope-related transcriptional attenuator domain-containing protein n=2 Tax=Cutibacterium avidum TaxID=33010 RepID=A0A3E2DE50_9ACTN|nr:LCP family protein [Cutibacterium avidum]MDU7816807.1 LCP family protein [Bacillota bacterium]MDU3219290.1 LCP family protein [Cutibacterium avidum]MDU3283703.1 LCP family protein [Cutibacterium avidum]MDU3726869.1 LCP family protein [Cutibacterium avidum]